MNPKTMSIIRKLSKLAWRARGKAYILGDTKVGAAVYFDDGVSEIGCNVEHRYRCHDVHAEVNAIGNMVVKGGRKLRIILIVARRDKFTPCGGCMDWIMQFGGPDCIVAYQSTPKGKIHSFFACDLMPHYPH